MKRPAPILFCILISSFVFAQQNPLEIFEPYMGVIWEGHYTESEDSALTHFIYWEYSPDSTRVFQIKTVPELDFRMVTTYYMDERWDELASLTILDENTYAVGYAHKEELHIESYSKNYYTEGYHETISHFELWEGNLIDRFYRKIDGSWYLENGVFYKVKDLSIKNKVISDR